MKQLNIMIGISFIFPLENQDIEWENYYQEKVKPFLGSLYKHTAVKVFLFISGEALCWLEKKHPESITLIIDLTKNKQIELIGGPFYSPVLSIIPVADRIGQIELMTTFLRRNTGKKPRGFWNCLGSWEPGIISVLKKLGIHYTFVKDKLIRSSGLINAKFTRPFICEDQGQEINIFTIDTYLSEKMLKEFNCQIIMENYLKQEHNNHFQAYTLNFNGLDWDKYSPSLFSDKGLGEFNKLLINNRSKIQSILPAIFHKRYSEKRQKLFMPELISEEIAPSCLKPEIYQLYAEQKKGNENLELPMHPPGSIKQILNRFSEANLIHSRMKQVHLYIKQYKGDKSRKKTAFEELWKGQFHSAFMMKKTGGILKNKLRKRAYQAYIEAEKITREQGLVSTSIISDDFDLDGLKEVLYQGHYFNAYIHCIGAVLFELDYISASWNYLDTFTRKEKELLPEEIPKIDQFYRQAFLDHFFDPDLSAKDFEQNNYEEKGDFIEGLYTIEDIKKNKNQIIFYREGTVSVNGREILISIKKSYTYRKTSIFLDYEITNLSPTRESLHFASEINLSLHPDDQIQRKIYFLPDPQEDPDVSESGTSGKELLIHDKLNRTEINLQCDKPANFWTFPIKTRNPFNPEAEEEYQASCLLFAWNFSLNSGQIWTNSIQLNLSKTR